MISKIVLIFFIIYNSIKSNNLPNEKSSPKIKEFINDNDSLEFLTQIVHNIFGPYDIFLYGLDLSAQCYQNLVQSFFQYGLSISVSSYPYYKKLLLHSSQNKNDLSTYSYCIKNSIEDYRGYYLVRNFTYLIVLIDDNKSLYEMLIDNNNASSYLMGLCFIDGCNKNDYKAIIEKGMEYLNLVKESNAYNMISKNTNNIKKPELKIYMINENNKSEGFIKFLEILPFIIIFIQIIFAVFSSIPINFYKFILYVVCCKYNKKSSSKNSSKLKNNLIKKKIAKAKNTNKQNKLSEMERIESDSSLSLKTNNDKIIKSLDLLYNTSNNFKSLMELKKQNEITNDGGIAYINGIKGIAMIFYLFGSVYSNLYSSIITEQNNEEFYSHFNNIFFSIYYVGIKFAPKLLLCTSGFSLFFKFICFLDEKFRSEREIERQNEESVTDGKEVRELKSNNNSEEFSNDNNENRILSNKYIFIFYGLQFHKYILYILILFFVIYSLDWIVLIFHEPGAMWTFFIQSVINPAKNAKYLIPSLIGYRSYFIPYMVPENGNILNYFFLVFQEIFYFLITTIIIFIGYKKNLRIDNFFKIIFFILIAFRIIYYFISDKLNDKDYFGFSGYGQFYTSLIYDYSFYIIGIHYGMINYIIQKGYTKKDITSQNKKYLSSSLVMLNASKKLNKKFVYIIVFISSLFLLLNTFIQQIIIYIIRNIKPNSFKEIMNYYNKDIFSEIIMIIDSDIFVIAFNALALCMYLNGETLINNILCHSLWSIFNRFYFSYIVLINPIILYIIYNIDSKINFNLANCLLYSFICGFFVFLVTIIIYTTIELPFKKTIRFWINLNEKGFKDRSGNIDPTTNFYGNNNLLSATASLTDFCEDSEDDEDEY